MSSNEFQKSLANVTFGNAIKKCCFSKDSKRTATPRFPPFPEQKAIASLLETWDTAIEKTEALIAAKEKRFKWLLKTLIRDQWDNSEWQKVQLRDVLSYEQPARYIVNSADYIGGGRVAVLTANKSFILGYTEEKDGIFDNYPVIIFDDFYNSHSVCRFSFQSEIFSN